MRVIARRRFQFFACACATSVASLTATDGASADHSVRLDRLNLLQYRAASGAVEQVKTTADWQKRRAAIVEGMYQVMGAMPGDDKSVPLAMKVEQDADVKTYRRQLVTYQSEPQSRTPAYLCTPTKLIGSSHKAPAVLCLHPTDDRVGHKVVVGLGGRDGRSYATELAQRGFVTIAPAYPMLADYQPDVHALGYASGTMKAIWDNVRALDLLASLPYVDTSRGFAVIGHSLGGHNGIFTAVLDPRITVVVSSCGFDSFSDYYNGDEQNWQLERGWCQERYMPRLAGFRGRLASIPFDFPELLGALAPRPVFVNAPSNDSNFRASSVDRCIAAARKVYELHDAEDNLVVRHPDCGHNFPVELRHEAYTLIESVLKPDGRP